MDVVVSAHEASIDQLEACVDEFVMSQSVAQENEYTPYSQDRLSSCGDQSVASRDDDLEAEDQLSEELLCCEEMATPMNVSCSMRNGSPWTPVKASDLDEDSFRPKRAMRFNVPIAFFRRDATMCKEWQLLAEASPRCKAAAAILSLVFAGTAMGLPTSTQQSDDGDSTSPSDEDAQDHAGDDTGSQMGMPTDGANDSSRGNDARRKRKQSGHVQLDRYTFNSPLDCAISWPMFQIGFEEIYDEDKRDVVAVGIWLFIIDETHSTTKLMTQVMRDVHKLQTNQRANGVAPGARNMKMTAESTRNSQAGMGLDDLDRNFENTVSLQYRRVTNLEEWRRMLDLHAGTSATNASGRPCVTHMDTYVDSPAAKRAPTSSKKHGSKHPMAVEHLFNAKRRLALSFGLVNPVTGCNMQICPEQTDPRSYWTADGHFTLPQLDVDCFWVCSSAYRRSIFDLELPRAIVGTVVPGIHLIRLFEQEHFDCSEGCVDGDDEYFDMRTADVETRVVGQRVYNAFRAKAASRDPMRETQTRSMRNALVPNDFMSSVPRGQVPTVDHGEAQMLRSEGGQYTIENQSATKKVAVETSRVHAVVIQPWIARRERQLSQQLKRIQLRNKQLDCADDELIDEVKSYNDRSRAFLVRRHVVVRDLVEYHLRMLAAVFQSTSESATIPPGYCAMFRSLMRGVEDNDGSCNIAFNGGEQGRGKQLTSFDRTTWGELQEILRYVFVDCCKIDGRDRRLMDAIYMQMFDVYADVAFVLIIASEKGKGKTLRAERMSRVLPPGWTTSNSASSARAGMNGNNSAMNGTMVVSDEMHADFTASTCGERMEMMKTVCSKREYAIERTMNIRNADGTEGHASYRIVNDRREVRVICCNMGQCFTVPGMEPDAGKQAMIQRTICLHARSEAVSDSPSEEFEANLTRPLPSAAVRDFRLFSSIVGFCRLAMMHCSFLQPDMAMAKRIFREGDRILHEEYGMPLPEPRRLAKRTEVLRTMCVMDAVARVLCFKQTAVAFDAGKPVRRQERLRGKPFDPADLWDVLRTCHPTRETILAAFSDSLEYSVATSSHGVNVMSAVCDQIGLVIDRVFRRPPSDFESTHRPTAAGGELARWMDRQRYCTSNSGGGVLAKTLALEAERMRNQRIGRTMFRRMATTTKSESLDPCEEIRNLLDRPSPSCVSDALFPTLNEACLFYRKSALDKWSVGRAADSEECAPGFNGRTNVAYSQTFAGGRGAPTDDYAWILLTGGASSTTVDSSGARSGISRQSISGTNVFTNVAGRLLDGAENCKKFDMHCAGVADCLFMLTSPENHRTCTDMPIFHTAATYQNAPMSDAPDVLPGGATLPQQPCELFLQKVCFPDGTRAGPHEPAAYRQEVRPVNSPSHRSKVPAHDWLDRLNGQCRLRALVPIFSSECSIRAPIRKSSNSSLEVNMAIALDHVHMILEASLRLSTLPGLWQKQDRFTGGRRAPAGLTARYIEPRPRGVSNFRPSPTYDEATEHKPSDVVDFDMRDTRHDEEIQKRDQFGGLVHTLPFSYDLMQIAWTVDVARRFYDEDREGRLDAINAMFAENDKGGGDEVRRLELEDMPELSLRYQGYPTADHSKQALRSLSCAIKTGASVLPNGDVAARTSRPEPTERVDVESVRYEVEVALGRPSVTEHEINEHVRNRVGGEWMHGVQGDVYAYSTWMNHAENSLTSRGFSIGDDGDELVDSGLHVLLDNERMVFARQSEIEKGEELDILPTKGSTYSYKYRMSDIDYDSNPLEGQEVDARSAAEIQQLLFEHRRNKETACLERRDARQWNGAGAKRQRR